MSKQCSYCQKVLDDSNYYCPSCGTSIKENNTNTKVKKEISNEEKAANKVINFIIVILVLAGFMYLLNNIREANMQEYRSKKMLELNK